MRVYFLSARLCALQVNGTFAGYTNGFPRFLELSLRDLPFCEFLPADGNFIPLRFVLSEKLAERPPEGISLCFLPDGVALYADKFFAANGDLRVLARKEIAGGAMTVYNQSGVRYLWEKDGVAHTGEAGENFRECKISACGGCVLLEGDGALCALDDEGMPFFRGKTEQVFVDGDAGEADGADGAANKDGTDGGTLRVVAPAGDFQGRTATYAFECRGGRATPQKRVLSAAKPLGERFALCGLLQALRMGEDGEAAAFLTDDLAASMPALKDYFGEYTHVFPLPFAPFAAGITCRKRPQVYDLKGYAAEMREGRIENISRKF